MKYNEQGDWINKFELTVQNERIQMHAMKIKKELVLVLQLQN